MASFFGEITALSSRADCDEDDSDLELPKSLTTEYLGRPEELQKSWKTVLFSVGKIASAFVKNYFLPVDTKPIAIVSIRSSHEDSDVDAASDLGLHHALLNRDNKLASVYVCEKGSIICDVSDSTPDELNIDLCNEILASFPVNQAVVLATYHKAIYKSNVHEEKSFLRVLQTSAFCESNSCRTSLLPLPNIVTKFPATVLTEFEVKGKVAVAFINYAETMGLDSLNVKVFEEVLQERIVSSNFQLNGDAKLRLNMYLKSQQSNRSNLYI